MQREQTAQDLAESQLNEATTVGSNTQLNTGELEMMSCGSSGFSVVKY